MAQMQEILSYKTLTKLAIEVANGISAEMLPAGYFSPATKIPGSSGNYTMYSNTRKVAKQVAYGSPSVKDDQQALKEVPYTCIHTFRNMSFSYETYMNLRKLETNERQVLGKQEITRQVAEFATKSANLRVSSVYSALCLGGVYFDGNGALLPSSSGAKVSLDYSIPSTNKSKGLAVDGSTTLISAAWSTAGTDIISDVKRIKATARKRSGYAINTCFYGANTLSNFAGNTDLSNLLNGFGPNSAAMSRQEIPSGFLGIKNWIPLEDNFFEDENGDLQEFADDDTLIFTPAVSPGWYEWVEGSTVVPTTIDVSGGFAAMDKAQTVWGIGAYGKLEDDPPSLVVKMTDTFMPLIKVPGSVYILDQSFS